MRILKQMTELRLVIYRDLLNTLNHGQIEMAKEKIQGMIEAEEKELERE